MINISSLSILDKIKNSTLTPKERQSIGRLLRDIDKTVFLNGQQMAAYCGISSTSMTRLVGKIGYKSFSSFKIDFEEQYKKTITPSSMFQDFLSSGANSEVIQASIQRDYANITNMESLLDEKMIYKVVDLIVNARKIYVVGIFASEITAKALCLYLWRLGKEHKELLGVGLSNKFHYSDVQEGDLLIAISTQRIFKEVLSAVQYANKEKMHTVAFTDSYTNPLATESEYALVAPVKGEVLDCTQVAMLMLVNIIANLAATEMYEKVQQILNCEAEKCKNKDIFCV